MSATCCRSQSMSQPNCCSIHVSHMMSLSECVSAVSRSTSAASYHSECILAKLLLDPHQPHAVARRVRLGQTVARSRSAVSCRSQSESQPNRCPIYVSRIVSLAVLSDLHQPHSVIRRHHKVIGDRKTSPSPASLNSNSECECPRQLHDVVRRVRLSQTVARSISAA